MSTFHLLDKSFAAMPTGGVPAHVVVVRDPANPNGCVLPSAANASGVLGVTTHSQSRQGRYVAVRRLGIAEVIAAGAIAAGDRVAVADSQGRVAAVPLPRFSLGTVGANNALVIEWLAPELFGAATTVSIADQNGTLAFGWSFTGGALVLRPATTSGDIAQTAAQLKASIEADATLAALIRVSHATGSSGVGLVVEGSAACSNLTAQINPIGIAEGTATAAGDRIPVLLTP